MGKTYFLLRYLSVVLVFIVGIVSSYTMFRVAGAREKERMQADFNTLSKDRYYLLQKNITGYFEVISSMGSTYAATSNQVGRDEFRLIVQYALLRQPDIVVLQWIPRVPNSKRSAFEVTGLKEGYPDFQISERDMQGNMTRAPQRREYFPLYYFEPFYMEDETRDRPNVGFDYASEPILREAMEKARDTDSIAITGKMKLSRLIREPSGQQGCAFFLPVYQPGKPHFTVEERGLNLAGFVAGAFNFEKMVEVSLNSLKPSAINFYLYDETAPPVSDQRLLFSPRSQMTGKSPNFLPAKLNDGSTALQWKDLLKVGGRTWLVLCRSTPEFFLSYNRSGPWIAFSITLLFTFLLCGYLYNLLHRAKQVERLVVIKTAELSQEITERKRAEEAVKESEGRLKTIMDSVQAAIMVIDSESLKIVDVNPVAVEMIGSPKEKIVGETCYKFVCPHEKGKCPVRESGKTADRSEGELLIANGKTIPVIKTVNTIMMKDHRYFVESFMDISERKLLEETLRTMSLYDELTGIYNRRGFFTIAEQELKMAKRMKSQRVLLFADLDGLKWINDNLGHQEGDLAIKDAADIFKMTFRESDIIARIGGDEFVVLAMVSSRKGTDTLIHRLQHNIGLYNKKNNRNFKLSLSTGITQFDPEYPCTIDELLSRADSIMYAQKKKRYSPVT
jgi:diguanylate cyclase (GGDEF)-like protein/PAS domain S-box-containing protein